MTRSSFASSPPQSYLRLSAVILWSGRTLPQSVQRYGQNTKISPSVPTIKQASINGLKRIRTCASGRQHDLQYFRFFVRDFLLWIAELTVTSSDRFQPYLVPLSNLFNMPYRGQQPPRQKSCLNPWPPPIYFESVGDGLGYR